MLEKPRRRVEEDPVDEVVDQARETEVNASSSRSSQRRAAAPVYTGSGFTGGMSSAGSVDIQVLGVPVRSGRA